MVKRRWDLKPYIPVIIPFVLTKHAEHVIWLDGATNSQYE